MGGSFANAPVGVAAKVKRRVVGNEGKATYDATKFSLAYDRKSGVM